MSDTTREPGHDLAPDEKHCPFCAETIKAAAVKCRYCQSDVAPGGAGTSPQTSPQTSPEAEPKVAPEGSPGEIPGEIPGERPTATGPDVEPEPAPEPAARLALPGSAAAARAGAGTRRIAVLVVACLVLAGGLWFLVHRAEHPHLATAPNGQVTESSFRDAAMSAASDAAAQILSYSYQTFDADRKKGRALVTGQAAKEYDKAMADVAPKVASTQITLKATVLSVGIISVKEHQARVLVFVDTSTTREGSKQQQLQQSRLVMDLTRKDGDWSVSKMDAF